MKILVADGSGLVRHAIAEVVAKIGHEPLEAEDGGQALSLLHKHSGEIGLAILDWNMPVLNGYETLMKIRTGKQLEHVPVLMATSDGFRDDVIKAIKAGAIGYLVKPFSMDELSKRIIDILADKMDAKDQCSHI